jgi:hypothetical protein
MPSIGGLLLRDETKAVRDGTADGPDGVDEAGENADEDRDEERTGENVRV